MKPVFASDEKLLGSGQVQEYQNLTSWNFFAKGPGGVGYDYSQVSQAAIDQGIDKYGDRTSIAQLDIETFKPWASNPVNRYHAALQFATVADSWGATSRPIGFYTGRRDYWGPVGMYQALRNEGNRDIAEYRQKLVNFQAGNDRTAEIINSLPVDFVVQSLYEPYKLPSGGLDRWRFYAEFNLSEQLRCYPNQIRYAEIQPNLPDGTPLDITQWQSMVSFLQSYEAIDAIIVFTRKDKPGPEGWREVLYSNPNTAGA